jgi:Mannose-6-phosphate isomerase
MNQWCGWAWSTANTIGTKHDSEDEFFYVVSGQLLIDLEDRVIDLTAGKAVVIPKGVCIGRARRNGRSS